MKMRSVVVRRSADMAVKVISTLSSGIGIAFLVWILWEVVRRGAAAFNLPFFTSIPTPPGVLGGGIANALLGTVVITTIAALIGLPIGILSGVYLSEFGKATAFAKAVRFTLNVIMGIPSIIVGMFVYTVLVVPMGHFSCYAGAVALAVIMIPMIARTTEDMLTMVPNALRESALAVGAPQWKVTLGIVFRAARSGLITGAMLAVARASGETAPLLFTALNSTYWPGSLNEPTANLTVTIFTYAMSPFPDWQQKAWGASLIIMTGVLAMTVVARILFKEKTT